MNNDFTENNRKIVFIFPHKVIQKKFWNNPRIIFLTHEGWWIISETDARQFYEIGSINNNDLTNFTFSVKGTLAKIRGWSAVISRWYDDGDQFDLKIREILFNSCLIARDLSILDVQNALFHTGVSHHVDSFICENACSLANIKQIFLYTEGFTGRLMPLVQYKNIFDRYPLDLMISQFEYTKSINDLLELKKNDLKKAGDKVSKRQESLIYSIFYLTFYSFVSNFVNFIRTKINVKSKTFDIYYRYRLITQFKQIIQQRKALNFYNTNLCDTDSILPGKNLLIVGHYQPEATSFPEGGDFTNHIDILLELRSKGFNKEIYYKEHPGIKAYLGSGIGHTRVGMARSEKYYKQLLKLGCKFLPMDYYLPISKSNFLPVTITGTIALERSLMGLHTIVTGEPWWKGLPGTIRLDEIKSLKSINKKFLEIDDSIKKESFDFLKNMLDNKTITNAVGIGTGEIMTGNEQVNNFEIEYEKLVSFLISNH